MNISKFVMPEVIFGQNSLGQVGESLVRLGAERAFLVTDEGVIEAGWIDKAVPALEEAALDWEIWSGVTPNPRDHEVAEGAEAYARSGCDTILAIGGGSPMDAAKGIAILVSNGGRIQDYEGVDKINRPLPPMVMAPTTAGTGADVSQFAVITDTERNVKMVLVSKSLVPDVSITDPFTLTTKDAALTACTGMDALAHAIESYVSVVATPLTDVLALNAVKLIGSHLRASVASRDNPEAKDAMATASLHAGLAFSNAILGATHAMAHQLGGMLDLPHGEVDAILLAPVMEYNLIACVDRYVNLAVALGERVDDLSDREAAEKAIAAVRTLAEDVGIPRGLGEVGVNEEDIPTLSRNAAQDACLITNPRDTSVSEIASIFQAAL